MWWCAGLVVNTDQTKHDTLQTARRLGLYGGPGRARNSNVIICKLATENLAKHESTAPECTVSI